MTKHQPFAEEEGAEDSEGRGGPGREEFQDKEDFTCYYCHMPGHISRDYSLRTKHLAEKQAELEKANTNPADVQMVGCEELTTGRDPREGNIFVVTRSRSKQNRKEVPNTKEPTLPEKSLAKLVT